MTTEEENIVDKYLRAEEPGGRRTFRIDHLYQFVELATWLYSTDDVIFRGQRCAWPLVPAVGRNPEGARWSNAESQIVDDFRREALPYLEYVPHNLWQWLALAQHNRLPTRLLDWSANPLAALWFAVSEPAQNGEPGVVWAHLFEREEAIYNTEGRSDSPFGLERTVVYFPEHLFPSIQAQSGVFTVHHTDPRNGKFEPLEETKNSDLLLTKIEIPAEAFPSLRYHLFRLGINPASLFPGLSGIVARLKYQHEPCGDE